MCIEYCGEVWVVVGDYFVSGVGDCNIICVFFELVCCDVFVIESIFGLFIYCWVL